MKKTKLKKQSKQKISLIQRKLWNECKRIIRARYPNICYTCGAKGLQGSNQHTGHMLAKASVGLPDTPLPFDTVMPAAGAVRVLVADEPVAVIA